MSIILTVGKSRTAVDNNIGHSSARVFVKHVAIRDYLLYRIPSYGDRGHLDAW